MVLYIICTGPCGLAYWVNGPLILQPIEFVGDFVKHITAVFRSYVKLVVL